MKKILIAGFFLLPILTTWAQPKPDVETDVLIIGGGVGGTAAAIQSARTGAKTLLVEPSPWLGGMLTAAGVGCTDGNHKLPSGIWNELREAAYKHYGTRNLATGWVSNFNIEPHVGDSIFKALAGAEKNLTIWYNTNIFGINMGKQSQGQQVISSFTVLKSGEKPVTIKAKIYVDATDLGDVLAMAGANFDVGLEADAKSGDSMGIKKNAPIIQDLTYAAILKDYGKGADKTIAMPANYLASEFDCACNSFCSDKKKLYSNVDAQKMLDYGKLPNGKYMINWPSRGNDFYTNIINRNAGERAKALDSAKQKTLRFIYFIQTQLGYKNLGLADDEFTSDDKLPYIAYHREGRRVKGLSRLTIPQIQNPYNEKLAPLYRTGISVGDYPIDHHHREFGANFPEIKFPPVPSYNVPAGSLISKNVANLVVCDKGISVSNGANGTTRLQPVVMLTGQAAGVIAAQAALQKKQPASLSVRAIQNELLKGHAFIMPYLDVLPTDAHWAAIQRVGAVGLLRGVGKPNAWANQTWFYPDSVLLTNELIIGLRQFGMVVKDGYQGKDYMSIEVFERLLNRLGYKTDGVTYWQKNGLTNYNPSRFINRKEAAVILDKLLSPFKVAVSWDGKFIKKK